MSAYHPQQQTAIENSYLLIHVVRHQHPVAPLVSALSTDQRFNLEARSVHISPRTAMGAMYFEIYLRRQHVTFMKLKFHVLAFIRIKFVSIGLGRRVKVVHVHVCIHKVREANGCGQIDDSNTNIIPPP